VFADWVPAFTDGSVLKHEGKPVAGAAIYETDDLTNTRVWIIDPNAYAPSIFAAELAALLAHLELIRDYPRCRVVYTDSAASLDAIHFALHDPAARLRSHPHADLLRHMVQLLLHRAGQGYRTALVKIKAHAGRTGNEVADAAAKYAAHLAISKAVTGQGC
jgi:ribonuclease HI